MDEPLAHLDLGALLERFDAFWARRTPEEPLLAVTAPRDEAPPRDFAVPDTLRERWMNVQYHVDNALWQSRRTAYYGAAFPMQMPNIGPDSFAAYLGGELQFVNDYTTWIHPFVDELQSWEPEFVRENRWWRLMCEIIDAMCAAAPGHFIVGIPDMHGGADALSAARHPDRLALDLYDSPDDVSRLMRTLTRIYKEVFDEYYARISAIQECHSTWIRALSRGRYVALQNDFSGLISPAMFEDFFLEEVRQLAAYLDNSIYHLDGPSALGNLPLLLQIQELDGIQWVQGAGGGPMSEWVDVCLQVLEGGKCLQIHCRADEVTFLLNRLPHEGLLLITGCDSESAALKLLRAVRAG